MKMSQLREVFESAGQLCRDSGNGQAAQSLVEFSRLFVGHEAMTVSRFATLLAQAAATENTPGE